MVKKIPYDLTTGEGFDISHVYSNYDILLYSKRLARDSNKVDLGAAERGVLKLICQYKSGDIAGVGDMFFMGSERIYGTENWATSNWISRTAIQIRYIISS
jgi:hypothetical protein